MKKQRPGKKKGKFIVVEGIDASGKVTQYKLLAKRLKKLKIKLMTEDFPRYYSSTWGELVGRFLSGEFGDLDKVSPYLAVLTYMMDQYTWSRDVALPWIRKGGWIITNRYFTSNIHQIARLKTQAQKKFREWLWPAGYEDLKILRPDLVIFIDTAPDVAKVLNNNKQQRAYLGKKKKDIAEKNWDHQLSAYREYKRAVKMNDWWVSVPGIKDPKQDFSGEIHKNVCKVIKEYLGIEV